MTRSAMSLVDVGENRRSSTTEIASPAPAFASMVSTKFPPLPELPAWPNRPDPRTISASGAAARVTCSPASLDTP